MTEPIPALFLDTCEEGKLTLDEYLERVVFHEPRHFTRNEFRELAALGLNLPS